MPNRSPVPPFIPPEALPVDTLGRRFHVEWEPQAQVTAMGQLVFFCQFLATSELFARYVASCPLRFTSPNAPNLTNLLGTMVLSSLAGHTRYAHVTALRADHVNPQGLGMTKICSEDSTRRAFKKADGDACEHWQRLALRATWEPVLHLPWILDMDVTIKPIYGHQEGAEVGYNPHKPGRPSHAYHLLIHRGTRLLMDVEARSGKEHAPQHGMANLWRLIDGLRPEQRPYLTCGDAAYGNERLMAEFERRGLKYLFRVRITKGVRALVKLLEQRGGWKKGVNGWEGIEGSLRLTGWTRERRVVVYRRATERGGRRSARRLPELLPGLEVEADPGPTWEYHVVASNLEVDVLGLCDLYRQRADAENAIDELKNQWGWSGFMTRDLLRSRVAARNVGVVYNWWSLFVACADPSRGREAVTSRPLLLTAVGRVVETGRQLRLKITSTHGDGQEAWSLLTGLSLFLSGLRQTAEQLTAEECWRRIWDRILTGWTRASGLLGAPSG